VKDAVIFENMILYIALHKLKSTANQDALPYFICISANNKYQTWKALSAGISLRCFHGIIAAKYADIIILPCYFHGFSENIGSRSFCGFSALQRQIDSICLMHL